MTLSQRLIEGADELDSWARALDGKLERQDPDDPYLSGDLRDAASLLREASMTIERQRQAIAAAVIPLEALNMDNYNGAKWKKAVGIGVGVLRAALTQEADPPPSESQR